MKNVLARQVEVDTTSSCNKGLIKSTLLRNVDKNINLMTADECKVVGNLDGNFAEDGKKLHVDGAKNLVDNSEQLLVADFSEQLRFAFATQRFVADKNRPLAAHVIAGESFPSLDEPARLGPNLDGSKVA